MDMQILLVAILGVLYFTLFIISIYKGLHIKSYYLSYFFLSAFAYVVGKLICYSTSHQLLIEFLACKLTIFLMNMYIILFVLDYHTKFRINNWVKGFVFLPSIVVFIWACSTYIFSDGSVSYMIINIGGYNIKLVDSILYNLMAILEVFQIILLLIYAIYRFIKSDKSNIIVDFLVMAMLFTSASIISVGYLYIEYDMVINIGVIINAIIGFLIIYKYNSLWKIEASRESTIQYMDEGFILLDEFGIVKYYNTAAEKIFYQLESEHNFFSVKDIEQMHWQDILDGEIFEIKVEDEYFRIDTTELIENNKITGYTLLIYNITEIKDIINKLEYSSSSDFVTKIYNRRYFFSAMEKAVPDIIQKGNGFMVAIFDLDFFKNVNDTYGHDAGDYVLEEVGTILKENVRNEDVPCRYGGEEFAIFFPNITEELGMIICESLRLVVEKRIFAYKDNKIEITISGGLAFFDYKNYVDIEKSIDRADNMVYISKEKGRNQINMYKK